VAGARIGADRAAVFEVAEDGKRVLDELVRFPAFDVGNETDAAGILIQRGIVESLRNRLARRRRYLVCAGPPKHVIARAHTLASLVAAVAAPASTHLQPPQRRTASRRPNAPLDIGGLPACRFVAPARNQPGRESRVRVERVAARVRRPGGGA